MVIVMLRQTDTAEAATFACRLQNLVTTPKVAGFGIYVSVAPN